MRYYLMHVRIGFKGFVKNGVYWVNQQNKDVVPYTFADFYPVDILPKYTGQKKLLLVRSGGIGDILALSAVSDIAEKTIILTQNKYRVLDNYFEPDAIFKSFNEPLFIVAYPKKIHDYLREIGTMEGEELIEQGSHRNWYEIFHESINVPFDPEYGRPQLRSLVKGVDECCIIVSKASFINRCADKELLTGIAKKYFKRVINADEQMWTLPEYLEHLDRAQYVISVDTSALHFREGLRKPALGLFSSFTADSRTKYYKHTKSIDIKSSCNMQPCFGHNDKPCPFTTSESNHVPCLSTEFSSTIVEQIENELCNIKF